MDCLSVIHNGFSISSKIRKRVRGYKNNPVIIERLNELRKVWLEKQARNKRDMDKHNKELDKNRCEHCGSLNYYTTLEYKVCRKCSFKSKKDVVKHE
jgi:ribosomal protein S14